VPERATQAALDEVTALWHERPDLTVPEFADECRRRALSLGSMAEQHIYPMVDVMTEGDAQLFRHYVAAADVWSEAAERAKAAAC
jgi:hypothetical protein